MGWDVQKVGNRDMVEFGTSVFMVLYTRCNNFLTGILIIG